MIYLCCVKYSRASYIVHYFIIVVRHLFILFNFCFHPILLFIVHCSFIVHEEIFNSDPGLYSRYFNPVIQEPSPSTGKWPIMIIDIEGYTKPIFSMFVKQPEGETVTMNLFGFFYFLVFTHKINMIISTMYSP